MFQKRDQHLIDGRVGKSSQQNRPVDPLDDFWNDLGLSSPWRTPNQVKDIARDRAMHSVLLAPIQR